jgi:hypothetical protein
MSLRADSYLSLCLEQADKSPIYFRHGCIIVPGDKIIGQGYNTYRSGFDGGALKHGNMVGGLDGPSIAEFKQHLKQKKKKKPNFQSKLNDQRPGVIFTPFEGPMSGHHHCPCICDGNPVNLVTFIWRPVIPDLGSLSKVVTKTMLQTIRCFETES